MIAVSIRETRFIGLLSVLIGACAASMAAPPALDGSRERPYPQPRQAADRLVSVARSALAHYHDTDDEPRVAVSATEAVSPDVIEAVHNAISSAGGRQTARGPWLEVLVDVQNRLQGIDYAPAPRAELVQPDLVLAIDEAEAGPDLRLVRGALITLRAGNSEGSEAGEIVPDSAMSAYVGKAPEPGESEWIEVNGTGFCNKKLPVERWRYSAVRAAEIAARAELARARCEETVEGSRRSSAQQLEKDDVINKVECAITATRVVSEHFDASSCRAVVTLTDGRAPPGVRHDEDIAWPSLLASGAVKFIFSLATGGL